MIWMKPNASGDWNIYHDFMSSQQRMKFNNTMAVASNASIFQSLPDTTKVTLGTSGDAQTDGGVGHLYCFKSVSSLSHNFLKKALRTLLFIFIFSLFIKGIP